MGIAQKTGDGIGGPREGKESGRFVDGIERGAAHCQKAVAEVGVDMIRWKRAICREHGGPGYQPSGWVSGRHQPC